MHNVLATDLDIRYFEQEYSVSNLPYDQYPFALTVPNGIIHDYYFSTAKRNRIIFKPDLYDEQACKNYLKKKSSVIKQNIKKIDGTVVCFTKPFNNNYAHWMTEVISCFRFIKLLPLPLYYKMHVPWTTQFQKQTLKHFGCSYDMVIDCHRNPLIKADNIIFIYCGSRYLPTISQFMYDSLPEKTIKHDRRIYVSRSDAKFRRVVNEKDVICILADYGFETIRLSDMNVTEQWKIFHESNCIVKPHGAGGVNTYFCKPGTNFIQFWPDKVFVKPDAFYPNSLHKHHILCKKLNSKYDMLVDIPMLENKLKELGIA